MPRAKPDAEDALEQATMALFASLGWQAIDAYDETHGSDGTLGRETRSEVLLARELRSALQQLNPGVPAVAITAAIEELGRDRSVLGLIQANREIYRLLKDGVKVMFEDAHGEQQAETIRVIDWTTPANNRFLLVSQFWVTGQMHTRRADLVGFVNGLPLLFIELKAHTKNLKQAYDGNLKDYKDTIPALFWANGLIILSNGSATSVGSLSASWEHFAEWKRINAEGEEGLISLDTTIRATCTPQRLLDLIENFTLFDEAKGGLIKLVAKNHQYLGVNSAVQAVQALGQNQGRLGVFWHTQGSGKSYSMVFFAQKILRIVPGNWTFVVITDRQELDAQIYKTFANVGAVTEDEEKVHAASAAHLRELLREDHRYVFTLIQKFRTEDGAAHAVLSERSDIIVITDEAHRSQYDIFAQNMRSALPNAAFIGFTGTPLLVGEEKTRAVFGEYVSIYNFRQSIEDGATVPLYYENRIPELQLTNQDLNSDMEQVLEEAELDEAQERKLEREFAREYHLITRDERLDVIAEDIVAHFMGRGYAGKAMVVSIDKATAVRMYNKVHAAWERHLERLRIMLTTAPDDRIPSLHERIAFMEATDMAVIVSQSQGEVEEFKKKGLDILPHRKRMVTEDLETKFKDPKDPLRIVFVCAMWMTGFDVPNCSTIYLDKPMRNHTLMQTIARANRVYPGKLHGLIVDYVGVFRNLQQALAIYGADTSGQSAGMPVKPKGELIAQLQEAITEATEYCQERGVDIAAMALVTGFERIKLMDDATELLVINDDSKRRFLELASAVDRSFRAILPDQEANQFGPTRAAFIALAAKIRSNSAPVDIDTVMAEVSALLDRSIAPEDGYIINAPLPNVLREPSEEYSVEHLVDLSTIDFAALQAKFAEGRKHTEADKLRGLLKAKLTQMIRINTSRMNYLETFEQLIDDYNAGATSIDELFARLFRFTQDLSIEEERHLAEQLSEEELALLDRIITPEITLSKAEREQVKQLARDLLANLKRERLVLDWRKKQQARAGVQVAIEEGLSDLPEAYDPERFQQTLSVVYQHIYDNYASAEQSTYSRAA
ncbi:MAG: type I restriction endonuclease subunit R [Roseiflexaceae bacterium]